MVAHLCLVLACATFAYALVPADKVKTFPGTNTTDLPFDLYSGYLNLTYTGGKALHYILATSMNNPATDPLVLWFNGGPGCSSLDGFFYENGPYHFAPGETYLVKNDYAWNTNATMLWIEMPAGVGFSVTGDVNNTNTNDTQTMEDNLAGLLVFLNMFPEYKTNEFFIAGESYGGVYVPDLAYAVHEHNLKLPQVDQIKLKGFAVGNGVTDKRYSTTDQTYNDFYWWRIMYSQKTRNDYENYCFSTSPGYNTTLCDEVNYTIARLQNNVNPYDVYRYCWHEDDTPDMNYASFSPRFAIKETPEKRERWNRLRDNSEDIPCVDIRGNAAYWNNKDNRNAFNVGGFQHEWFTCVSSPTLNYTANEGQSIQYYPTLVDAGYRILIYSGDTDSVVPTTGTRAWINAFKAEHNLNITSEWRQWYLDNQVAGFTEQYNNTFTLVTIKGTGHMSIQWKRPQGKKMFDTFLQGGQY